jgi:putative FmdB family regulatory protein
MPIYTYRCAKCLKIEEVLLPMSERNTPRICVCGAREHRVMEIPRPAIFTKTGRDKILGALNKEEGYVKPGENEKHDPRYIPALARGLDPPQTVIGRGF